MLPGVYYYYPVTSIGKHTTYTTCDSNSRHTRASTALSGAVALVSRAVCISITQKERDFQPSKAKVNQRSTINMSGNEQTIGSSLVFGSRNETCTIDNYLETRVVRFFCVLVL